MNILIVDDQANLNRVTAMAFRALGCRPFTAQNTVEAARILDTEDIDALFLDVNLDGESGWDYLSHVRAQPMPPPVVMFTAHTREDVADDALRGGALDCIVKPFSLDELRHQILRIKQYLDERKNRSELP